jgi:hypothetical protein
MTDLTPKELRRLQRLRRQFRGRRSAATDELLVLVARNMSCNSATPRERMEPDRTISASQVKFYRALMQVASENEGNK